MTEGSQSSWQSLLSTGAPLCSQTIRVHPAKQPRSNACRTSQCKQRRGAGVGGRGGEEGLPLLGSSWRNCCLSFFSADSFLFPISRGNVTRVKPGAELRSRRVRESGAKGRKRAARAVLTGRRSAGSGRRGPRAAPARSSPPTARRRPARSDTETGTGAQRPAPPLGCGHSTPAERPRTRSAPSSARCKQWGAGGDQPHSESCTEGTPRGAPSPRARPAAMGRAVGMQPGKGRHCWMTLVIGFQGLGRGVRRSGGRSQTFCSFPLSLSQSWQEFHSKGRKRKKERKRKGKKKRKKPQQIKPRS